jgi:hypothetical protein
MSRKAGGDLRATAILDGPVQTFAQLHSPLGLFLGIGVDGIDLLTMPRRNRLLQDFAVPSTRFCLLVARVSLQSLPATLIGSMPVCLHHARSLPRAVSRAVMVMAERGEFVARLATERIFSTRAAKRLAAH